jgi:hypothetical protein
MLVICGNKIDLNEMRKIDFSEGEKLAKENNCNFFEVSAKSDTNMQKMLFHSIVELPFFESFKTGRMDNIVGELELENNETKGNASSFMESYRQNDIKVIGRKYPVSKNIRQNCKC